MKDLDEKEKSSYNFVSALPLVVLLVVVTVAAILLVNPGLEFLRSLWLSLPK